MARALLVRSILSLKLLDLRAGGRWERAVAVFWDFQGFLETLPCDELAIGIGLWSMDAENP